MPLRRAYAPNGEAWSYERFIIKFGNAGGPMFCRAEKRPIDAQHPMTYLISGALSAIDFENYSAALLKHLDF